MTIAKIWVVAEVVDGSPTAVKPTVRPFPDPATEKLPPAVVQFFQFVDAA